VKLQSAWDRRVVLSGASSLKGSDVFRQVYIAHDESLDTRRRNTLDRLKDRAERARLSVMLSNGVLSIDGNDVFPLEQGYLVSRDNVVMLLVMDRTLNCLSYNCRGFNVAKRAYIKSLLVLLQCDILFIQEHWLSDGQLDQLGSLSPDHLFTAVSGFDNSDVLSGRPYGGCAILWRRNISLKVIPVNVNSRRLCYLSLSGMHFKALCINVYMPYEHDGASFDEFVMQNN